MTGAPTRADVQTLQDQVIARLRQAPRISAVATLGVPLLENMFGGSMFESPPGARPHYANDVPVSGPFFDVARLTLLDGRLLTEAEIEGGQPLAVVSELTARAFWPERRAVGEVLIGKTQTVTVVGVVEEARFGAQDDTRAGEIYLPGSLSNTSWKVYLLRTGGDPDVVVREAALLLHRDVAGVLVRRAESFESALWNSVRLHRFRTVVFGVSAAAGLLLVAVGIGGLVATGVARRVREIGIRHALGASRPQLVRMLVVDYLRPSLAGVALGLLASWWTTRLLDAFLYRIDAHNPAVWAAAALGLLLVAASAAWIPARRASAVDPMVVLKAD
jgi:hypothetical protein